MKKLFFVLMLMISLLFISSCSIVKIYNDSFIALGTVIDLTIYDNDDALKHYKEVLNIMRDITKASSAYKQYADSSVSIYALNENKVVLNDNKYFDILKELLNYSIEIKNTTNGYFNPLIGSISFKWKDIIEEYNKTNDSGVISFSSNEINNYLSEIKNSELVITDDYIELKGNALIDLGAIAKGYATKKAIEYLDNASCNKYILNAGKSNIAFGTKPKKEFNIMLTDYDTKDNKITNIGNIVGNNMTITTSAMGEQSFYYDDSYYHHIISPIDGYPKSYYTTVSIFNLDPMLSDAYATAIFSMDIDEAKAFIEENDLEAILYSNIGNKGYIYKSIKVGDYFYEN